MSLGEKIADFLAPKEEEEHLELTKEEAQSISQYETSHVKGVNVSADTNIVLFEPRHFDEAEEIARHIKNKRACCVNMRRMPSEYRVRAVDFLSGVVFGVDGIIRKVGDDVILCSPKNLQVGGNIDLNNQNDSLD